MSFHNYEKKVNRKTNKIRQFIDEPKKYKNVAERNAQKKKTIDSKNEGKKKKKKKKNRRFR